MLAKPLIGIVAALVMVGIIATVASAEIVTGSGIIQTVTWSPNSPPHPINIFSLGETINLNAPGPLQINGYTIGTDGPPYNIIHGHTDQATFDGVSSLYNIKYTGIARITGYNQWTLLFEFPQYPGFSVTLGISGGNLQIP
jgi:hypothetical protein